MKGPVDTERLQSNIAWALKNGLPARDLVPMLGQLLAHSPQSSEASLFAALQLAELIVEDEPWRAAVLARRVLDHFDDERAWGVLALAHTLLGNHRCARKAYNRALLLAPGCPSYAHNLGHLIDVVFDEPAQSLKLLSTAHRAAPDEQEIAASYAHALVRTGRWPEAREVLSRALGPDEDVEGILREWVNPSPSVAEPKAGSELPALEGHLSQPAQG